jgi:hypothetical protein
VPFSLINISNVKHFVAREAKLVEIYTKLSSDSSRQTVVLHSLSRIRKTQLSIAYTKRHKENYLAIFWLNIKDKNTLKQSFAKIIRQISREHLLASRLSNIDTNKNLNEVVNTIKAWLSLLDNTR